MASLKAIPEIEPEVVRLPDNRTLDRPQRWRNQRTDPTMAWVLLSIAGIIEIAFAFCMKWSEGFTRLIPALLTVATGLSSVFLLSLSLRTLPVGTGYAVWTGIGAAGTAIMGIAVLGDSAEPLRILCILLILAGVIGLKLVSGN
jgi:quaternary ammonium compound-resistance protein SugE